MKRSALALLLLCGTAAAEEPKPVKFDFEDATVGTVPKRWTVAKTGTGEGSVWKVAEDQAAPKGIKVLAQTAQSPNAVFNLCVAEGTDLKDVELSVAFKAVEGKVDQGGGVVWRYQDQNNYYIARYNPLENNYRVYKVVAGKRTQLETKEGLKAPAGQWHTVSIRMAGNKIECSLNGRKYVEAKDDTFTKAGKVGLWTKADAQTYFDDFHAKELK
jgi:3-keto-disaccharide hydrolase